GYDPMRHYEENPGLRRVIDQIAGGHFSPDDPHRFRPIVDSLLKQDTYLLLADFADYVATQARVDELFARPDEWHRRAALNVAGMGPFSSDRSIREYAERIWNVKPLMQGGAMPAQAAATVGAQGNDRAWGHSD